MTNETPCHRLALRRDEYDRLLVVRDGVAIPVRVQLCFPWTDPAQFFSLRDAEDNEVAFVADADDLDVPSREALRLAAQQTRFVFDVNRVVAIEQEHELRLWRVETAQGARRFQTKLDDWPRPVGRDAWLVRDVSGDLYLLRDLAAMDAASRQLLSAYIDLDPV